jgi:hypothetical protein
MISRLACQYSIVKFLPYSETGELLLILAWYYLVRKLVFLTTKLIQSASVESDFVDLDKKIYMQSHSFIRKGIKKIKRVALFSR